ncbi:hypothetical protein [Paenibacillus sp. y28]|uniref:hypothetical protein n=1 Tax=Paenibacillus sp. y28 TaxID=3129110 RepID=UPI00301AB0F0
MKKATSLLLSAFLLSSSLTPFAYAEEAAEQVVSSEEAAAATDAADSSAQASAEEKNVKLSEDYEDLKVLSPEMREAFDFYIRAGALKPDSDERFGADSDAYRQEAVDVIKASLLLPNDEALTAGIVASYEAVLNEQLFKLGITNSDGIQVQPEERLNRESLAKYLIYALKLEGEARKVIPTVDTSTQNKDNVTKALATIVTYALQKSLLSIQEDGTVHGSDRNATVRMLVQGAYEARKIFEKMNSSSTVSIVEAKASGAQKVDVVFKNSAPIQNVTLTVKNGDTVLKNSGVTWSGDGKTATITLEKKLTAGDYSVELTGVKAEMVDVAKAEFKAEDEQVTKLEFANGTDYLPRSKVLVQFKLMNQYGETIYKPTSQFDINIGRDYSMSYSSLQQAFELDLSSAKWNDRLMISIYDEEHNLRLYKVFEIQDEAVVSKVETGNWIYNEGRTYLRPSDKAYLEFKAYDQYGYMMINTDELNNSESLIKSFMGDKIFEKQKDDQHIFEDINLDNYPEMVFQVKPESEIDGDSVTTLRLTALGSGETVTKDISVVTPKKPASVFIADPPILAKGDVDKTIDIEVKDAEGYPLSAEEIDALVTSGELKVSRTGSIELGSKSDSIGGIKGRTLRIKEVEDTGTASVEITLKGKQTVTKELTLNAQRLPSKIVSEVPNFNAIIGQGANTKFIIYDQYNEQITTDYSDFKVDLKLEKMSGDSGSFTTTTSKFIMNDTIQTLRKTLAEVSGTTIKMTSASGKKGAYKLTANVVKVDSDANAVSTVLSATAKGESFQLKELADDLRIVTDSETTFFAFGKYYLDRGITRKREDKDQLADQTESTYLFAKHPSYTYLYTGLKVIDKFGNEIGFGATQYAVTDITVLDTSIVAVDKTNKKLLGLNPGTTKAYLTLLTPKGTRSIETNLTVFSSDLIFKDLVAQDKATNVAVNDINGRYVWDSKFMGSNGIIVTDDLDNKFYRNTGTYNASSSTLGYTNNLTPFFDIFSVRIALSDVEYVAGTQEADKDTFYMTSDYKLVYQKKDSSKARNLKSFKITVTAGHKEKSAIYTVTGS